MRELSKDPNFKARLWEKGEAINLLSLGPIVEMRPTEVHLKVDGATDNGPSFCFVLQTPGHMPVVAQISARMLRPAVEAVRGIWEGY